MTKSLIGLLTSTLLSLAAIDEVPLRSLVPAAVVRQAVSESSPSVKVVEPPRASFDIAQFQADGLGGRRLSSRAANAVLKGLFDQTSQRIACIVRASHATDGSPSATLEAAGYVGGSSSTVMVHDGTDHPDWSSGRRHKGPHVHLWDPPPGAAAWVHTHHPTRGLLPSVNDVQASIKMTPEFGLNLPFLVATAVSVTAYWHGFTNRSVVLAGRGWMDALNTTACPPAIVQR